ncbi:MAG: DUF4364 family protein [Clostridiales bacterium]|nr:DUF4364 family protein [Clostridiales bacterium]
MSEKFESYSEFDAYTYGIKDGGLRSVSAINLLVCYVVANSAVRLTSKNICDAVSQGEIANYFETTQAISRLTKEGIIVEDESGFLIATDECRRLTEIIENDLPYTVREASIKICKKLAEIDIYKKENRVDITESGGIYYVTMHITDKNSDFMVLKLSAATKEQAQIIKEKFLNDPTKIYDNLINSIFE